MGITGGKGGTGKSTVATSLAWQLSEEKDVLLVDLDVDCPNDHLLLGIERRVKREVTQRIPFIDSSLCTRCGRCGEVCRTGAIVAIPDKIPIVVPSQCNGCGSCSYACPHEAISWKHKKIGKIYTGSIGRLSYLGGELELNEMASEKVVDEVKREIGRHDIVIIDTAAGTHCNVISALEPCDKVIAVTEPTPLGAHDLELILELLDKLDKPSKVVLNKDDGDDSALSQAMQRYGKGFALRIPFDRDVVDAYSSAKPIMIGDVEKII